MTKARMTVSLDPEAHEKLASRAKREGRTPGNLAAFLLSLAIEMELGRAEVLVEEANGRKSITTQQ